MPTYHLLFDANNFFTKILHATKNEVYGKRRKDMLFDTEHDCDTFKKMLVDSYVGFLKRFPTIDQIVFCQDGKSWRKQLIMRQGIAGYKSSRKTNEDVNYKNYNKVLKEFFEEREEITQCYLENAEADDLIYFWNKKIKNTENDPFIFIISADNDFYQLLDNRTFMINHFERSRALNVHENYEPPKPKELTIDDFFTSLDAPEKEEDDDDFFNFDNLTYAEGKNIQIEEYIQKLKREFTYTKINVNERMIYKIFCGEKGDDVPSCYHWEVKNKKTGEPRTVRITPKHIANMLEKMEWEPKYTDPRLVFKEENLQKIHKIFQDDIGIEIDYKKLKTGMKTNYVLVYLNDIAIPKKLQENFVARF